jgi:hypothetical protein
MVTDMEPGRNAGSLARGTLLRAARLGEEAEAMKPTPEDVQRAYPTLAELAARGDRSPDNESLRETYRVLELLHDEYDFPLSRRKVMELIESVIACRDMLAEVRAEEREAERARCAKVAEAHGISLGEYCWNHENGPEGISTCWAEIAAAIRAQGGDDAATSE